MQSSVGRQDAYRARTRAALIRSALDVMGKTGFAATIEELAANAEVSPATIYNHFGSKEEYLKQALAQIWQENVDKFYEGRSQTESLAATISVCRKLFRVSRKSSTFGKVLTKTMGDSAHVIDAVLPTAEGPFREVASKEKLPEADFELRLALWSFCLAGIFREIFVTANISADDADRALAISMTIWNIDPLEGHKLVSEPLY